MSSIEAGKKMNEFISHSLDDKVFFYAIKVEKKDDLTWSVDVDPAACLVSMADNTECLPTVNDLRVGSVIKKIEKDRIIYEGRILLSSGIILLVNDKILMLLRDNEAPVDPFKWTSPAGRCDREPFLTALKEFYEEVILFDSVSGKPVFVTFPDNNYFEEAKEIYRITLERKGFKHSVTEWIFIDANFEQTSNSHLHNVRTCFKSGETTDDSASEVFTDMFFPFMDEDNNTLELRLLAFVSIPDNTEFRLAFCDGEYQRTVKLFTIKDFMLLEESSLVGMMSYYKSKYICGMNL